MTIKEARLRVDMQDPDSRPWRLGDNTVLS